MSTMLGVLRQHDERALHYLIGRRRRGIDLVMHSVTHLADAPVAIAVALALALGLAPGLEAAGLSALFTLTVSHLAVQLLKRTVNRARPALPPGAYALLQAPDRFSFPSGHAAAGMSLALGISTAVPPQWQVVVLTIAGLIGVSRCYLGVHYPGDVVAGWGLALLAALASGPALSQLPAYLP